MTDSADFSLKIRSALLDQVCGAKSSFPVHSIPEFAFAGRSNVGKSSLINMLMQRKSLARTSATPGKTQTINYYLINQEFYFVDLPGYGFTKASPEARQSWGRMVERYLRTTASLMQMFLLVDIRHKPTADDQLMYEWICSQGLTPVILATKLDKLKKNEIPPALREIRQTLALKEGDVLLPVSSRTGKGREELYQMIQRRNDHG